MTRVVLAIDTPPLAHQPCDVADFVSQIVFTPLSGQLFLWNAVDGLLTHSTCCAVERSRDMCTYTFHLRKGLKTSGGRSITASDFVASWEYLLSTRAPAASRLAGITKLSVSRNKKTNPGCQKDCISVQLANPDSQLPNKLAHPSLGPHAQHKPTSSESYAGPFRTLEWEEDHIVLSLSSKAKTTNSVSEVEFRHIADGNDAIDQYLKGYIQSTCPASFPVGRLQELSNHRELVRCISTTFFVLIPVSNRANNHILKKNLHNAIETQEFLDKWPGALSPFTSFVDLSHPSNGAPSPFHTTPSLQKVTTPHDAQAIRIAYDGFHPNKEVVELIVSQLGKHSIQAIPVEDNYFKPSEDYDFKLMIVCNSPSYPLDLYRRIANAGSFNDQNHSSKVIPQLLDKYDALENHSQREEVLNQLEHIIAEKLPLIPLFRLNQFALCCLPNFTWHCQHSWTLI